MHNISPFFRSGLTDVTGGMVSHQLLGRCQREEMALMDCLEAYGLGRGLKKCQDFIGDYKECHTMLKQFKRFCELRNERDRQIACGKRCGKKMYSTPKLDSF